MHSKIFSMIKVPCLREITLLTYLLTYLKMTRLVLLGVSGKVQMIQPVQIINVALM